MRIVEETVINLQICCEISLKVNLSVDTVMTSTLGFVEVVVVA